MECEGIRVVGFRLCPIHYKQVPVKIRDDYIDRGICIKKPSEKKEKEEEEETSATEGDEEEEEEVEQEEVEKETCVFENKGYRCSNQPKEGSTICENHLVFLNEEEKKKKKEEDLLTKSKEKKKKKEIEKKLKSQDFELKDNLCNLCDNEVIVGRYCLEHLHAYSKRKEEFYGRCFFIDEGRRCKKKPEKHSNFCYDCSTNFNSIRTKNACRDAFIKKFADYIDYFPTKKEEEYLKKHEEQEEESNGMYNFIDGEEGTEVKEDNEDDNDEVDTNEVIDNDENDSDYKEADELDEEEEYYDESKIIVNPMIIEEESIPVPVPVPVQLSPKEPIKKKKKKKLEKKSLKKRGLPIGLGFNFDE